MKTLSLFLTCFFLTISVFAQTNNRIPQPKVDQRVELLSIVFRLAGNKEYNTTDNVNYVDAIHRHFDKFVNHPLISYAKELRDSAGISYDAVMAMAIHLKYPPDLDLVVPFSPNEPDQRWSETHATRFVSLLKQFYKDADCNTFFQLHAADYALAQQRFDALFKNLDVAWYYKFYGKSANESFNIIIGLCNGGGNYGPHIRMPDGSRNVYAIIGSGTFDSAGVPVYESSLYLPTLIHEFNHSFINYLNDRYREHLDDAGKVIFEKEAGKMRRQAYTNWKTMMDEALVRASVIMYLKDHNSDTTIADRELKLQLARGFVWIQSLVNLLGSYEKQRSTYPTLESFMPEIVQFYETIAPQITMYENDYLQHCAKVVSAEPFNDKGINITATTSKIIFNFDKELDGIRYFFGPGPKGKDHYPKPIKFSFGNNNKSVIMEVQLMPNTEYQVKVNGSMMRAKDGYSVQDYILDFKTGDK
jgi:hypothetical protein